MLKALYLRSSFEPGGTESLLVNLYNMQQDKIQFYYAFLKDGSLIKSLDSKQNKYFLFPRVRFLDFKIIKKLLALIKSENIEIIHSHQLIELVYGVTLKLLKRKTRLFHTIHGYHDKKWPLYLERILVRFTEKYFTVSKATRDHYIKRGYPKQHFHVLYNAVEVPKAPTQKEIDSFKKIVKYNDGDFLIGMIGNFVWWKDQLTLIKAFEIARRKTTKAKLVLIGMDNTKEGELCKVYVQENAIENVYFMGRVTDASKYLFLFDLFVFSTIADTFGIALVEAMMAKCQVIASDIEVCKELSDNEQNYKLFKLGQPDKLANRIIESREKINKVNLALIQEKAKRAYSYSSYIENLNILYK